jgi:hypothetical protein
LIAHSWNKTVIARTKVRQLMMKGRKGWELIDDENM